MDRRRFLRNATIAAVGVVAADQLELLERLGWTRRLFAGWSGDDTEYVQRILDRGGVVPPGTYRMSEVAHIRRSGTVLVGVDIRYTKPVPYLLDIDGRVAGAVIENSAFTSADRFVGNMRLFVG